MPRARKKLETIEAKEQALAALELEPKPRKRKTKVGAQTVEEAAAALEAVQQPDPEPAKWADRVDRPEPARSYVEAVDRPFFAPVPEGFFGVASSKEGIRVIKKTIIEDGRKVSVAGIQFAVNRLPSREEKNLMERVSEMDPAVAEKEMFRYSPQVQVWLRKGSPDDALGENVIDAVRVMTEMSEARKVDREQMEEVFGR